MYVKVVYSVYDAIFNHSTNIQSNHVIPLPKTLHWLLSHSEVKPQGGNH